MNRTPLIVVVAAAAAFLAAFGVSKAMSGSDSAAPSPVAIPQSFDVPSAQVSTGASNAGLPDLKAKPKPTPSATAAPVAAAVATTTAPATTTTPSTSVPPPSTPASEQPVRGGGQG